MDNLLVFICTSQEDVLRISKKSSDYSFHRYYITTGFEINKQSDIFSDSDSFLSVDELDSKNYSAMSRIALLYSMPSYENIIILKSIDMFDLAEIKFIFGKLEKGDQISRDYLIILQRQNVALNGFPDVQDELISQLTSLANNTTTNTDSLASSDKPKVEKKPKTEKPKTNKKTKTLKNTNSEPTLNLSNDNNDNDNDNDNNNDDDILTSPIIIDGKQFLIDDSNNVYNFDDHILIGKLIHNLFNPL